MASSNQILTIDEDGRGYQVKYPETGGFLEISENYEVGIEVLEIVIDTPQVIIDEHAWKTINGRQILIRKGDSGALNGNDMRKINIAVEAAVKNPGDLDKIRESLVGGYIPEIPRGSSMDESMRRSHEKNFILDGTRQWAKNPNTLEAGQMAVSNNVMKGRARHVGLSKYQLQGVERHEEIMGKFPHDDLLKAVNVQAQFNRNMAKEKFGSNPFTVYRGIYGPQAEAIKAKAKRGDTVRIDSNSLTSWSTNKSVAKDFMTFLGTEKRGVVISTKVTYKNVFDSYASSSHLNVFGKHTIDEVIVSPRGLKITGVIIDD